MQAPLYEPKSLGALGGSHPKLSPAVWMKCRETFVREQQNIPLSGLPQVCGGTIPLISQLHKIHFILEML